MRQELVVDDEVELPPKRWFWAGVCTVYNTESLVYGVGLA